MFYWTVLVGKEEWFGFHKTGQYDSPLTPRRNWKKGQAGKTACESNQMLDLTDKAFKVAII